MPSLARTALSGAAWLAVGSFVGVAAAQTPPPKVADDAGGANTKGKTEAVQKPDSASKRPEGWTPGIALGGTLNIVDTRSVVGQTDGTTVTMGAGVDASLEFNTGIHEWRNALRAGAGTTYSPALAEFVKSSDGLSIESIYLIHPVEWLGPYFRVAANTQMFPGLDVRATPADYVVANLDGTTTQYHGRRLYLTDPFQPFTFKESAGVFVQPIVDPHFTFEGRAGLGAQETLAKGNLAIQDDAATATIEVKELDDFYQVGGELVANAWGFFDNEKRVSYSVGVGVLFPFLTSDLPPGDNRSLIELTTVEGNVGLNAKLFDWASIGYKLTVARQPLLVDEWQVTNSLLLTLGAAFGSKAPVPPPPAPPPPPCNCEPTAPAGTTTPAPAPKTP
ncbi:MAG: hypothetical protein U0271_38770 [Polyangiaceae bacterium]